MIKTLMFPLMRKYRKLILSMIAVSSLGIALMVGLSGAYDTLSCSFDAYLRDYGCPDAVITTELTQKSTLEQLRSVPGVQRVDSRLIADTPVRLPSGRISIVRGISYAARDFQSFHVWDMNESDEYPNAYVDYMFASRNHIQPGDILEIKLEDGYEKICVGAVVSSVECLNVQVDAYSMSENPDFGFLFLPEEVLYETEYFGQSNQFLFQFDESADEETILEQAEAVLGDCVVSSYLHQDSGINRRIEINLQPLEKLSILIPVLFFICMIAVVSLFLSQIIRQSRRDIGILRALGFEKQLVRKLFSIITLLITSIACVLGMLLGVVLMKITSRIYGDFFPLPQLYTTLNPWLCLLAVIITTIVGQISAYLGTAAIASILPSEAMSRETPAAIHTPGWMQALLRKASASMKFCITSIFRNQKRFVFSVICIASSIMLILASVAFNESKNGILVRLFEDRIHYGCQIFFREEPTAQQLDDISAVPGISGLQPLEYYHVEAEKNGKTETILVAAVEPDTDMVTVYGIQNEVLAIPDNGLILEKHTADALGIAVGDEITLDGVAMPVVSLSDQSINRVSYLSVSAADALGEADRYTLLCDASDEERLLDVLSEMDSFTHADFTHLIQSGLEETFATYSIGVSILIGFAVMLGVIIVYNTMQTNLLEQKKELSVLRAIGFQVRDISNIWLIQTGLQFALSCCIGIPAGILIARYSLQQMATEGREYPFSNSPAQYFVTIGLTLAYILISHYAAMRIIRKWDISENTKEKE